MSILQQNTLRPNQGLAAIPMILMLAIMVVAIPLALKQSQQVTTVQNRAATYGQIGEDCSTKPCDPGLVCLKSGSQYICQFPNNSSVVPCDVIRDMRTKCSPSGIPLTNSVPCSVIDSMLQNCNQTPSPTRSPIPTIVSTTFPLPTTTTCTNGQTKYVGKLQFVCKANVWVYQPRPNELTPVPIN